MLGPFLNQLLKQGILLIEWESFSRSSDYPNPVRYMSWKLLSALSFWKFWNLFILNTVYLRYIAPQVCQHRSMRATDNYDDLQIIQQQLCNINIMEGSPSLHWFNCWMKLTFIRSNQRQILITIAKKQFKIFIFVIFSFKWTLGNGLKKKSIHWYVSDSA